MAKLTKTQLQNLKKRYIKEGYKLAKKRLNESYTKLGTPHNKIYSIELKYKRLLKAELEELFYKWAEVDHDESVTKRADEIVKKHAEGFAGSFGIAFSEFFNEYVTSTFEELVQEAQREIDGIGR